MKKLIVLMAAAFAMVACQTDINEVGVAGGEVNVTFEVGTPTRAAYSDGTTATVLQYAVYEGTEQLRNLTVTDGEIHGSTKVELQLVTGNEYTVIFWAAAPGAPYSVDWATGTMTVDYDAAKTLCNAENRDAFYKRHTFTVKGAQTETIELRRPFAQLNIGTNDYDEATDAGYTPVNSAVKVTNVYKTLNLWDGAVDNAVEVNFDYNTIAKTETFPVTGYQYLAMNYLLVAADKEVVDIEFGYKEENTAAKTRVVGSVPVQRNYRTNIYGQLLTSDVDINVVIVPEYETPDNNVESGFFSEVDDIVSLQEAIDEAPAGELTTIILSQDIDLYAATRSAGAGYITRVENGSNIIIDGRGHKFNGQIRIDGKSELGQETTIIRNVNFETSVASTDFIWTSKDNTVRYANNVTIENCTFTATGEAVNTAVGVRAIQAYNFAIKGCVATGLHSLAQVSSYDNAIVIEDVTVNGKNGIALGNAKNATIKNATITATGYGIRADALPEWAPSLSVEESTIAAKQPIVVRKVAADVQPYAVNLGEEVALTSTELHQVVFTAGADDAAYVAPAEGSFSYTSANDFVVFPYVVAVSSYEELVAATASKVILAQDITCASNLSIAKDIELDLNGKVLTVNGSYLGVGDSKKATNVTIKNGNINGRFYALYGNTTLSNVKFGGAISYLGAAQGVINIKAGNVTLENCDVSKVTLSGTTKSRTLSVEGRNSGSIKLANCNFSNSRLERGYINPLSGSAVLEITKCKFGKATNIDTSGSYNLTNLALTGNTGGFTFTFNRYSTALTEAELATLRGIKANNSTIRFIFADGEKNTL